MNKTNKLTVPDLISIGVFTALYFVLVTIATFASVAIFPGFNNVVLPAFCALISGCVYTGKITEVWWDFSNRDCHGIVFYDFRSFHYLVCCQYCNGYRC